MSETHQPPRYVIVIDNEVKAFEDDAPTAVGKAHRLAVSRPAGSFVDIYQHAIAIRKSGDETPA